MSELRLCVSPRPRKAQLQSAAFTAAPIKSNVTVKLCSSMPTIRLLQAFDGSAGDHGPSSAAPGGCRGCGPLLANVGANGDAAGPRPKASTRPPLKRRVMLAITPWEPLCRQQKL